MTNGTITLPSGQWDWVQTRGALGTMIHLRHSRKPEDEMTAWSPLPHVSDLEVREIARDPLDRLWSDADGVVWRLSLEVRPGDADATRPEPGSGTLSLHFRRGSLSRRVEVPAETSLGVLAHGDLVRLFQRS
jgi:hypothetical protein